MTSWNGQRNKRARSLSFGPPSSPTATRSASSLSITSGFWLGPESCSTVTAAGISSTSSFHTSASAANGGAGVVDRPSEGVSGAHERCGGVWTRWACPTSRGDVDAAQPRCQAIPQPLLNVQRPDLRECGPQHGILRLDFADQNGDAQCPGLGLRGSPVAEGVGRRIAVQPQQQECADALCAPTRGTCPEVFDEQRFVRQPAPQRQRVPTRRGPPWCRAWGHGRHRGLRLHPWRSRGGAVNGSRARCGPWQPVPLAPAN